MKRTRITVTAEQVQRWQDRQQENRRKRAQRPAKPTRRSTRRHRETGPTKETRELIRYGRAQQRCEVTGVWLGDYDGHIHHRRPRGSGGSKRPDTNSPANLLLISVEVHDWIERHGRADALEWGLLLHQEQDPAVESVQLRYAPKPVWLTSDGDWTTKRPNDATGVAA